MELEEIYCPRCGSHQLTKKDKGAYYCDTCQSLFAERTVVDYCSVIESMFDKERQRNLSERKKSLFQAVKEKHRSTENILSWCRSVQEIDADDMFAAFYMAVEKGSKEINKFFKDHEKTLPKEYVHFMLNYLLRSIKDDKCMTWISYLIQTKMGEIKAGKFREAFKKVTDKINSYVYATNRPRDIFLAYSSKDMKTVMQLLTFLEQEGYSVFVAFRNLWNGTGAVENYQRDIEEAIRYCKCLVFVSSEHSRHKGCDAIDMELPYIFENCPRMKRIEYLLESYGEETSIANTDFLCGNFFKDLRYVTDEKSLTIRIKESLRQYDKETLEEKERKEREETEKKKREEAEKKEREERQKEKEETERRLREMEEKLKQNLNTESEQPKPKPFVSGEHEHNFIKRIVAATCISKGYTEFRCTECDKMFTSLETPLRDHQYELVRQEKPTCTKNGTDYLQCKLCSQEKEKTVPALGHIYGEWETTPPTCATDGSRQKVCATCGDVIRETIPATGHSYGEWKTTPATCTTDGSRQKVCATCGDVIRETIPAKGHSLLYTVVLPTCTEEGKKEYKCIVCGKTTKTDTTPATGHNFTEWKKKNLFSKYRVCCTCETTEFSQRGDVSLIKGKEVTHETKKTLSFGRYPQSEKLSNVTVTQRNGKYIGSDGAEYVKQGNKYFKVEPIQWRILEEKNGYATILSEKILSSRRYDSDSNNYANSEIRKWLNGEFLREAFTSEQQSLIQAVTVDNSADSTTDTKGSVSKATEYACENTTDKVWLLSVREVANTSYGFNADYYNGADSARQKEGTAYAKSQGLCIDSDNGKGYWWLRSPCYYDSGFAWGVSIDGDANIACNVISPNYGVVPALKIKLS